MGWVRSLRSAGADCHARTPGPPGQPPQPLHSRGRRNLSLRSRSAASIEDCWPIRMDLISSARIVNETSMPNKPVRGTRGSNRKHLPTEATRGLVKGCVACGASQESICSLLDNIALPTLYKYYREELDTAMVRANVTMAQALFDNGVKSNNVTAQLF